MYKLNANLNNNIFQHLTKPAGFLYLIKFNLKINII
jgi:hypothetical protein